MFIDIHAHAYRTRSPAPEGKQLLCAPDQLLERYDKLGVERGVLLPLVSPESLFPQANEDILEMAENSPDRFIPFCNIDPRSQGNAPDAPLGNMLRYYRDLGCKGIGEVTANLPFLHPKMQNLFRHVEQVGFPLTFHIAARIDGLYGIYDDPGLPQLEYCLMKFPKLKIFAHSQTFWAEMARLEKPADRYIYPKYPVREEGVVPKLMRQYPNLYGDLSAGSGHNALARDPDYGVKFLNEFQDRLMFGLDICAPEGGTPLVDLLTDWRDSKKISEEVFQKVARENAIRLLGLD